MNVSRAAIEQDRLLAGLDPSIARLAARGIVRSYRKNTIVLIGDPPPELLIVLGSSAKKLEGNFYSVELVGHTTNREGVANEETTDYPDIFLCRHLRGSWPDVWKKIRHFG